MTAISNNVASIYGANAAPLATSIASLGAAIQAGSTNGGNTAVATGYSATPATTPVGTRAAQPTLPQATQNAAAANNVSVATLNAATSTLANGSAAAGRLPANPGVGAQLANDLTVASGGGQISDALKTGVSSIVAFAQTGMANIQKAIQADMAANNGEVDPAKMQLYTMKMSTYELLNQMAAKIQEKEEAAMQRWLR